MGKMPVIVTAKPAAPATQTRPKPPEPVEEPVVVETPLAASATATAIETATVVAVETARRPGPLAGAMGREKYIGPGHVGGKVPVVGAESKQAERKKSDGQSTVERARPAVKLAPLPKTSRPIEPPTTVEPPAQKPDLRLPADILGADRPYTPVPYFWTDQYDVRIQAYGLPSPAAEMTIAEGDVAQGRFAALYREDGRVTAVLGWNMPKQARLLRQRLLGSPPAPHPLAPA